VPMGSRDFFLGGGWKVLEFCCSHHVFQVPKMFLNIFPTCSHLIPYPLPVIKDIVKDLTCVQRGLHLDKISFLYTSSQNQVLHSD